MSMVRTTAVRQYRASAAVGQERGPSPIRSGDPVAAAATMAACPDRDAATRAGARERPFSSPVDSGTAGGLRVTWGSMRLAGTIA